MVGKITRIPLREVWRNEASDFTTWLEENIWVINEVTGLSLENAEREQSAGSFSVDIVAEDSGQIAIIENQLERSDHDHLGKLITYLTVLEAKIGIWIVASPRPEHVKAVSWLNESSSASFYLLKVEAIKIGDSAAAPLITQITGPSAETREAGETKKYLAERDVKRKGFWTGLLDYSRTRTKLHNNISASMYNWIGSPAGLPQGLNLNYSVRQHDAQVELYIDGGKESGERNREIFDRIFRDKETIEERFGEPLEWERLNDKRACRIKKIIDIAGWMDEETWPDAHEAMVDAMIKLESALRPCLDRI